MQQTLGIHSLNLMPALAKGFTPSLPITNPTARLNWALALASPAGSSKATLWFYGLIRGCKPLRYVRRIDCNPLCFLTSPCHA
jgi:hypothetical protein